MFVDWRHMPWLLLYLGMICHIFDGSAYSMTYYSVMMNYHDVITLLAHGTSYVSSTLGEKCFNSL